MAATCSQKEGEKIVIVLNATIFLMTVFQLMGRYW